MPLSEQEGAVLSWNFSAGSHITSHHGPFSFPSVLYLLALAAWTPPALLVCRAHSGQVLQVPGPGSRAGNGKIHELGPPALTRRIPISALVVLSTGDPGAVPSSCR